MARDETTIRPFLKEALEKAPEDIITTFPFPKGEIDIDTVEDIRKLSSAKSPRKLIK